MIVIGDIHGCYKSLMALIKQLPKGEKICFVGDLMDRGPRSRQVIEYVKNSEHDCVKGNHEDMMIHDLSFQEGHLKVDYTGGFCRHGGLATLESYKTYEVNEKLESGKICKVHKLNEKLIKSHLEWMDKLPIYIEYKDCVNDNGDYLIVAHTGGIGDVWKDRNNKTLKNRFDDTVMWQRKIPPKRVPNAYSIFGHTPQQKGALVKKIFACIDTGCCFKSNKPKILYPNQKTNYGVLTAIQFPSKKLYIQPNIDW